MGGGRVNGEFEGGRNVCVHGWCEWIKNLLVGWMADHRLCRKLVVYWLVRPTYGSTMCVQMIGAVVYYRHIISLFQCDL